MHYWEEPVWTAVSRPELSVHSGGDGVRVLTPQIPHGSTAGEAHAALRSLLDHYLATNGTRDFISWYYTPMALLFSEHLNPAVTVYDCMDELSAFQGAPPGLIEQERRLFELADVVFAGGASLFASKRTQHSNVHLFPSSIDQNHFATARQFQAEPEDQKAIPRPRVGFYGVLDERLDQELLRSLAAARRDWHFVLIGPVVKIAEEHLPKATNIHYLGQKTYASLPRYLSGWEVAMQPFAINDSTKFISPTKTPEFLAAGKPVVSTAISDVVRPYGELGLVEIAEDLESFLDGISRCLISDVQAHNTRVDKFLCGRSWDKTFDEMWMCIDQSIRHDSKPAKESVGELSVLRV